jgi:hypothetical protein
MRRLAVCLIAAAALGVGCGSQEDARPPADATADPTEAQLAYRERILQKIETGDYKCYCTGELRARERAEKAGSGR